MCHSRPAAAAAVRTLSVVSPQIRTLNNTAESWSSRGARHTCLNRYVPKAPLHRSSYSGLLSQPCVLESSDHRHALSCQYTPGSDRGADLMNAAICSSSSNVERYIITPQMGSAVMSYMRTAPKSALSLADCGVFTFPQRARPLTFIERSHCGTSRAHASDQRVTGKRDFYTSEYSVTHQSLKHHSNIFATPQRTPPPNTQQRFLQMVQKEDIDLSKLPRWDLEAHFPYTNPYDPKIDADVENCGKDAEAFQTKYKGKLDTLLAEAVPEYETLCERMTVIQVYLFLHESVKQSDDLNKRQSSVKSTLTEISANNLMFFSLELAEISDAAVEKQIKESPALEHYRPYIFRQIRVYRPHNLGPDVERAIHIRDPWSGDSIVTNYYEKQVSRLRFDFGNDSLNIEQLLSLTHSAEPQIRYEALRVLNTGLSSQMLHNFSALSLNSVSGSWHIENAERGYKTLRAQRNLSNDVSDDVVDALLDSVRTVGVELGKKYYTMKKAILKKTSGITDFTWADRNAPLGLSKSDKIYSFEEAVEIVFKGFLDFSPKMAEMFQKMVESRRIDAPAVNDKRSGAFCHGATAAVGPFQLLNYNGRQSDVTTLAHESGHACHDILAYQQGFLQTSPSLTLAETASIFAEMIVFRDILKRCESKEKRLAMLMDKVDDVLNSVVRQGSFDYFEEMIHTARKNGVVSDDDFTQFWMKATTTYFGEAGEVFDKYEHMNNLWSYVGHFHRTPFYVYSYAFADLVVGSLYGVYLQQPEGFEEKLLNMLSAGGTQNIVTAFAPFNLNPSKADFWVNALRNHLGSLMNEAEVLALELGYLSK